MKDTNKERQQRFYESMKSKGYVKRSYYHRPEDTEKIKDYIKKLEEAPH